MCITGTGVGSFRAAGGRERFDFSAFASVRVDGAIKGSRDASSGCDALDLEGCCAVESASWLATGISRLTCVAAAGEELAARGAEDRYKTTSTVPNTSAESNAIVHLSQTGFICPSGSGGSVVVKNSRVPSMSP